MPHEVNLQPRPFKEDGAFPFFPAGAVRYDAEKDPTVIDLCSDKLKRAASALKASTDAWFDQRDIQWQRFDTKDYAAAIQPTKDDAIEHYEVSRAVNRAPNSISTR